MQMRKNFTFFITFLMLAACGQKPDEENQGGEQPSKAPNEAAIGDVLPLWQEGWLDIHAISTGRGECTFFMMPDGTSMIIDAGEVVTSTTSPVSVTQRPNSNTRAYFTQSRYIKHTQTGLMALYTTLPYKKLIDRAWSADDPEYEFVKTSATSYSAGLHGDYTNFVKYATSKKGLVMERFQAGTDKQLTLCYNAAKYPSFKIFNYGVNGEYWNGTSMVDAYGSAIPYENGACCISLISYGKYEGRPSYVGKLSAQGPDEHTQAQGDSDPEFCTPHRPAYA